LSCFRLFPRVEEETTVLRLMKDPVPIIRVGAARVALKIGSTESVNAILGFLLLQKRYVRNLLGVSAREASEDFVEKIRARLQAEKNPRFQKIYLDLISSRLNDQLDGDWVSSLTLSEDKDLRISALRALCRSRCKGADSALIRAITDSEWEARATACRLMGEQKFVQGLPSLVKAAQDPNWWVRRNSTFALARLGLEGQNALNEILRAQDRYSADIAKLALMAAKKAA
jgi:HEAT repeat protein